MGAFVYCDNPALFPTHLRGAAVAVGNFDGFHRGHQYVFAELTRRARAARIPAVVMSFEPHPCDFFARSEPLLRLSGLETKKRLAKALGVDALVVLRFDQALSEIAPQEFVDRILIEQMGCPAVIVGENFRFGHKRTGDIDFLRREGALRGFAVSSLDPVEASGTAISSTRIRQALASGDLQEANTLLGYHWFLQGELNDFGETDSIELPSCRLSDGVYAVRGDCGSWPIEGVAIVDSRMAGVVKTNWLEAVPRLPRACFTVAFIDRMRLDFCDAGHPNSRDFAADKLSNVAPLTDLDRRLGVV